LEKWDNFIASHTTALAQDRIKKKCPGFIGKKRIANEFARYQSIVCSAMLGHYLKYAKTDQHCRAEDCLAIDME